MTPSLLIVKNDLLEMLWLSRQFSQAGYHVLGVPCAPLALEAEDLEQFAVALMDVSLPGINGLQLMRRLQRRNSRMQVILCAYDPPTWRAHAPTAFDCLPLGCKFPELRAAVEAAFLASHQPAQAAG